MHKFRNRFKKLIRRIPLAGVTAAVGVVAAYLIGTNAFDASMTVEVGGNSQSVTAGIAVVFTWVTVILGGLVATAFSAYTQHPVGWFTMLAVGVFVAMSTGPIVGGADTATTVTLLTMHVVVLVTALAFFLPSLNAHQASEDPDSAIRPAAA